MSWKLLLLHHPLPIFVAICVLYAAACCPSAELLLMLRLRQTDRKRDRARERDRERGGMVFRLQPYLFHSCLLHATFLLCPDSFQNKIFTPSLFFPSLFLPFCLYLFFQLLFHLSSSSAYFCVALEIAVR
jgi:hypothetical protein